MSLTATAEARNKPYPAKNVVKTEAEARIFHGQIAKPRQAIKN